MIDGHIQFFYGFNILGFEKYEVRITGLFGKEQIIGSFVSRLLPLSLLFFTQFYKNNINYKLFFFTIIILTISTTLISGQRTSFFYTITILLITFILNSKLRKDLSYTILPVIFLIITTLYISDNLRHRMINETLFNFGFNDFGGKIASDSSLKKITSASIPKKDKAFQFPSKIVAFTKQHEKHFAVAILMFEDNYLFGQGPKLFRDLCKKEKYYTKWRDEGCSTHPHNTYIQLLAETGIVGAFVFIVFFILCFSFLINKFYYNYLLKKNDKYSNENLCLILCFFISLFPFVPTGNFFATWLSAIYFLPLGIFLYHNKLVKTNA